MVEHGGSEGAGADGVQGRARIRSLLAANGLTPNRRFGQNFLADPNMVRRIVRAAAIDDRKVLEVGAGTGTLTAALAEHAGFVLAYEVDDALAPVLASTIGPLPNVELRIADVVQVDLATVLAGFGADPWTMVANLPYNVGTGIVLDALRATPAIERFVVMVQDEVADRMLATPGTKVYGIPSVVVALHAKGRRIIDVPPQVFEPPPRVASAVIALDRIPAHPLAERAIAVASVAFGQRRKMLRRSLADEVIDLPDVLARAGIDPTMRPEQLAPADYVAIAEAEGTG